jgi:hypothetical protein
MEYAEIKQYFKLKTLNYKEQDKKEGGPFVVDDYVDHDWLCHQLKAQKNKCCECYVPFETLLSGGKSSYKQCNN